MDFEALIAQAAQEGCSDLHLTAFEPPVLRRDGALFRSTLPPVTPDDILALAPAGRKLTTEADMDFACRAAGRRLRVNIFHQNGAPAAAVRLLAEHIPTLAELHLPPVLEDLCAEPNGLILVTGPTGSGKSTTLAAMIDRIAESRAAHIITIEDPVEYVYANSHRALIHQRELGRDVGGFAQALRSALREDPDIILVGEMRDLETISAAVTAAETGHLVLSTLHTTGAARTVERIVDSFPSETRAMVRTQLSGILRGVVTQQLVPLLSGGRVAATEIMLGTDAVRSLIREGKSQQLASTMQLGGSMGMHTMEFSLAKLVREQKITADQAARLTGSPVELKQLLGY